MKTTSGVKRLVSAWNDFWFSPEDPTSLGVLRVLVGGMLIYTHFVWGLELDEFFGPEGWQSTEAVRGYFLGDWLPSLWWYVPADSLRLVHVLCFVPLVLFFLGAATPVTSVLALIVTISNSNRALLANYGLDQLLSLLTLYLTIGGSGGACSVDAWFRKRRWERGAPTAKFEPESYTRPRTSRARLGMRLIQVHFCVIYFFAGISKLQGESWWNGEALWRAFANQEYQSIDMTWLAHYTWLLQIATHVTILWEISFPFVVWNRTLRPFVLAIGVMMHAGIGLFMGMITFGSIMIFGYLGFVPPERLERLFTAVRMRLTGQMDAGLDPSESPHPMLFGEAPGDDQSAAILEDVTTGADDESVNAAAVDTCLIDVEETSRPELPGPDVGGFADPDVVESVATDVGDAAVLDEPAAVDAPEADFDESDKSGSVEDAAEPTFAPVVETAAADDAEAASDQSKPETGDEVVTTSAEECLEASEDEVVLIPDLFVSDTQAEQPDSREGTDLDGHDDPVADETESDRDDDSDAAAAWISPIDDGESSQYDAPDVVATEALDGIAFDSSDTDGEDRTDLGWIAGLEFPETDNIKFVGGQDDESTEGLDEEIEVSREVSFVEQVEAELPDAVELESADFDGDLRESSDSVSPETDSFAPAVESVEDAVETVDSDQIASDEIEPVDAGDGLGVDPTVVDAIELTGTPTDEAAGSGFEEVTEDAVLFDEGPVDSVQTDEVETQEASGIGFVLADDAEDSAQGDGKSPEDECDEPYRPGAADFVVSDDRPAAPSTEDNFAEADDVETVEDGDGQQTDEVDDGDALPPPPESDPKNEVEPTHAAAPAQHGEVDEAIPPDSVDALEAVAASDDTVVTFAEGEANDEAGQSESQDTDEEPFDAPPAIDVAWPTDTERIETPDVAFADEDDASEDPRTPAPDAAASVAAQEITDAEETPSADLSDASSATEAEEAVPAAGVAHEGAIEPARTMRPDEKPAIAVCDPDWKYRSFGHYLTRRGFPAYVGTAPVNIWRFIETHNVDGAVFFVDRLRTREYEMLLRDLTLYPLNEFPVVLAVRRNSRVQQALKMESPTLKIVRLPQTYRVIRETMLGILERLTNPESDRPPDGPASPQDFPPATTELSSLREER